MKKLLALLIIVTIFAASSPITAIHNKAFVRAYELFIPIACQTPDGVNHLIGTGFPVAEHIVMTARHVDCEDDMEMVSLDKGKTWIANEGMTTSDEADMRLIAINSKLKDVAKFRLTEVGEEVAGFGVPNGSIFTTGKVIKMLPGSVFLSNTPIGGMSGSAIVAEDGKVVGMTVEGWPVFLGNWPAAFITRGVSSDLLVAFVKRSI